MDSSPSKMIFLSLFIHLHVVSPVLTYFLLWNTKECCYFRLYNEDPILFWSLLTFSQNIVQNIFSDQQKKECYTGLEWLESGLSLSGHFHCQVLSLKRCVCVFFFFSHFVDVVRLVCLIDWGHFNWSLTLMWIIKLWMVVRVDCVWTENKMFQARESGRREGDSTSPHWLVEYVGLSVHVRSSTESWLLFPSDCEHVEELRSVKNKDHLSCKSYNETWICTTVALRSTKWMATVFSCSWRICKPGLALIVVCHGCKSAQKQPVPSGLREFHFCIIHG